MSENVIRLATSQSEPVKRACRDCRFYEPKLDTFWGTARRRWHARLWPPAIGFTLEPTALGHAQAICTAFGGDRARDERATYGRCKPGGALFAPRDDVTRSKVVDRGGAR